MVYDREMGSMRVLLTSPLPRSFLLLARLLASCAVSIGQVYVFLVVAAATGVPLTLTGAFRLLPALLLGGMLVGGLGMLLAARVRQLENFAGVMNFVIFPMFFLSPALYPLSRMAEEAPVLHALAWLNPFTHAVELNRAALQGGWGPELGAAGSFEHGAHCMDRGSNLRPRARLCSNPATLMTIG